MVVAFTNYESYIELYETSTLEQKLWTFNYEISKSEKNVTLDCFDSSKFKKKKFEATKYKKKQREKKNH